MLYCPTESWCRCWWVSALVMLCHVSLEYHWTKTVSLTDHLWRQEGWGRRGDLFPCVLSSLLSRGDCPMKARRKGQGLNPTKVRSFNTSIMIRIEFHNGQQRKKWIIWRWLGSCPHPKTEMNHPRDSWCSFQPISSCLSTHTSRSDKWTYLQQQDWLHFSCPHWDEADNKL